MANSYALNLYSIRLQKRFDTKKEYILSDFGAKQDMLSIIENMFESWKFKGKMTQKSDEATVEKNQILKVDEEKVVKIQLNDDGSFSLTRIGRMLEGVIMY